MQQKISRKIIIILIILASITAYSGKSAIDSSKLLAFSTQMKVMQAEVDVMNQELINGNQEVKNYGEDISNFSKSEEILNSAEIYNQIEENSHTAETLEEEKEKYSIKEEKQEENNNEIKTSLDESKIKNEDVVNIDVTDETENHHEEQESTTSEQTVDNTNEIIENIENPEIKQEFKEIKEKMEQLNDNPQVVTDDFNEMYAKLFGRLPIQDVEEQTEKKDEETDIDILKDNVSVFEVI